MSKTVDELTALFQAARGRGNVNRTEGDRKGVAAVIRALRDELQFDSGMACDKLNEILGSDAGEKVAGGPRPEAMGSAPPATDPAPDVCAWTPLRAGSDLHTTACGKAIWRCNEHAGICLYCKAPIKFTEAKT